MPVWRERRAPAKGQLITLHGHSAVALEWLFVPRSGHWLAPVESKGGTADFYSAARGQSAKSQGPPAAQTAVPDQPIAPVRIGPNGTYRSPSKRLIWACLIGAKFVGLVLIVMPGSSIGSSRLCRLAACFITFSRVSSSPHCLRTWTVVSAIDWP